MNRTSMPFTRRDFVRGTLGTAVGAAVISSALAAKADGAARSSRVVVVRDKDAIQDGSKVNVPVVKKMLEETLMRVTGQPTMKNAWLSLVKPDDMIGLVPTFGPEHWGNPNHTHRELVEAVEAGLLEAGIPKQRIHNVQATNANLHEKCTALINLPALKAHWLTGIGTVLKNYIMFSGKPSAYHHEDSVKLGEIWELPSVKGKTKLVLVDALRPLCDKGPQVDPRYVWSYNGLLAGTDPVAVETVCLRIITRKREVLRGEPWPLSPPALCIAAADQRYKLGTSQMAEIRVETAGWTDDLLIT
jgi:hypothetical protein